MLRNALQKQEPFFDKHIHSNILKSMDINTTLYVMLTLMAIAINILLAGYTWRHRSSPGAKAFTITLVSFTWWALSVVLAILVADETFKAILYDSRYIGAAGTAPFILLFALQYTGQRRWSTRRLIVILCLIPSITQVLLWTNAWHHLWTTLDGTHGVAYWIHSAYFYVMMFIALILISLSIINAPTLRRWQIGTVLVGVALPVAISVLMVFDLLKVESPNTTGMLIVPISFTVAVVAIAWALYRNQLFDLTPLARETLIDDMQHGILVLNTDFHIVDTNPAVRTILNLKNSTGNGQSIARILPIWETLSQQLSATAVTKTELALEVENRLRDYAFNIIPLHGQNAVLAGYLLRFQDITERKKAEAAIHSYAQELETQNRELDAFVHTVAHDLKNPLSVIIGFSSLLEDCLEGMPLETALDNLNRINITLGFEIITPADDTPFIRFWAKDNGPGLSPEEQAVLFTQFTRLHETRAEGHGLGLSIVQRIITKLGGTVGVESQLGSGSSFWFTLPQQCD